MITHIDVETTRKYLTSMQTYLSEHDAGTAMLSRKSICLLYPLLGVLGKINAHHIKNDELRVYVLKEGKYFDLFHAILFKFACTHDQTFDKMNLTSDEKTFQKISYPVGGRSEWSDELSCGTFWENPKRWDLLKFIAKELEYILETTEFYI